MEGAGLIVWKMFVVMWVSFLSAAIFLLWGEDVPWLVSAALRAIGLDTDDPPPF